MCLKTILTLSAALFVVSCTSTKTAKTTKTGGSGAGAGAGAGRNPYLYPEGRLGTGKSVKTTSVDGRFVFLNDGSIWNIDWSDAKDAARWGPGESVSIKRSRSNSYPYVITAKSGRSVSARYGKKLD